MRRYFSQQTLDDVARKESRFIRWRYANVDSALAEFDLWGVSGITSDELFYFRRANMGITPAYAGKSGLSSKKLAQAITSSSILDFIELSSCGAPDGVHLKNIPVEYRVKCF